MLKVAVIATLGKPLVESVGFVPSLTNTMVRWRPLFTTAIGAFMEFGKARAVFHGLLL